MKKKTHEEFVEELKYKNPKIKVIGIYDGMNKGVICKCLTHNIEWSASPYYLLRGSGCKQCKADALSKKYIYSNDIFIEKLNNKRDDIALLSEYKSSTEKLNVKCKLCGYEWSALPTVLLNNTSHCKICSTKSRNKKLTCTHEQFVAKLKKVNKNIVPVDLYVNSKHKILCECRKCLNRWMITPNDLLRGRGCPKCGRISAGEKRKLTHEDFVNKLQAVNSNIDVMGDYSGVQNKIKCKCKVCDHVWETNPSIVLAEHGCPKCNHTFRRTHEDFLCEMSKINPKIQVLTKFEKVNQRALCQCEDCNTQWKATPANLMRGSGCPNCSFKEKESKGEKRVRKYLEDMGIEFTPQKKFFNLVGDSRQLAYDFYIEGRNLLIEYQGEQHERPVEIFGGEEHFKKQIKYDNIKREYAKQHNIRLLEIWYWDFENIKHILSNELGNCA